jgi:hypothetical protein
MNTRFTPKTNNLHSVFWDNKSIGIFFYVSTGSFVLKKCRVYRAKLLQNSKQSSEF